jgi:hypothetical protein
MTDLIGALEVPIPVPDQGKTVADPFLDLFGDYLMAAINADTKAAWSEVHPNAVRPHGEPLPVCFVKRTEPSEGDFRSNELPALFVYRASSGKRQRVSQDWQMVPTTLHLLWVPPRAQQKWNALRQPFKHAIESAIDRLLDGGRHPAWIVKDDPDPKAEDYGSYFYAHAKLFEEPVIGSAKDVPLKLPSLDGSTKMPDEFDCFLIEMEIRELKRPKMDDWAILDHAESTISIGLPNLVVGAFNFQPTLSEVDVSSGPAAGGTILTITGDQIDENTTFAIDGILCTDVTSVDARSVSMTTPAHLAGGPFDIVATTTSGQSATLAAAFTFT